LLQTYGCGDSEFGSFESWKRRTKGTADADLAFLRDFKWLPDELVPAYYVRYALPQQASMLEAMGVRPVKRVDYIKGDLVPRAAYFTESVQLRGSYIKAITDVLSEVNILMKDDASFMEYLRNAAFIPSASISLSTIQADPSLSTASGMHTKTVLYRAADLFDPRIEELSLLLDQTFFPFLGFHRDDILVFLRAIGLQTSLDWKGILACARFISGLDETGGLDAVLKKRLQAVNLLQFLDKNYDRLVTESRSAAVSQSSGFGFFRSLFGEKPPTEGSSKNLSPADYVKELSTIAWIPVAVDRISPNMPWLYTGEASPKGEAFSCLASPVNSRLEGDAWYCSVSKRICTEKIHSDNLKRSFGWLTPLDGVSLSVQLTAMAKLFHTHRHKVEFNEGSEEAQQNLMQMQQTITGLIPHFYQRLDALAPDDGNTIVQLLESEPWVWVGDTFVNCDRVAHHATVNSAPFLYQLPQDLQVFHSLMKLFRIRHEFTARDYLRVLQSMAESTNAVSGSSTLSCLKDVIPLSDTRIDLAVSIITLLGSEGSINPEVHSVYVPDTLGRLAISTDLVNDDVPWLSGPEYASVRARCRLIHKSISSAVAEKFGVKSLRLFLVNSSLNQSLFAVADAAVEAFGQSESITNRLKTILDMYPDGSPIFSELIQNADDAGAKEISIMLDENTYR
jgi:sacsin